MVILFDYLKNKAVRAYKGFSLLDVGLSMNLEIKLQRGMKLLENGSTRLCSSWESFILTWRWDLFFCYVLLLRKAWEQIDLNKEFVFTLYFYSIKSEMGERENSAHLGESVPYGNICFPLWRQGVGK